MGTSGSLGRRVWVALAVMLFALAVGTVPSAKPALGEPEFCGREPVGGPIVHEIIPAEDEVVARGDLGRVGATLETRRDVGVAWAGVFVDGEQRSSALMGPARYCQSTSTDITDLKPGVHTVTVVVVDSEGRVGGHAWTFTVV